VVAARLWDLDALAARYRLVLAQTQALTARAGQHAPGAAAFRAFAAATLPVYDATAEDPDLPADLLPADWPGDQLASTLGQAMRTFYPLINDYLATVTGA
jgi:DNA-binding transcriptional regulator PaaX